MISKSEYELLKKIKSKENINITDFQDLLFSLLNEKLIEPFTYIGEIDSDTYATLVDHYEPTIMGNRQIEEYEAFLNNQQCEQSAVKLAKEANDLSEQSNNIAKEANRLSNKSNTLSKWSICVAIFSAIIAIVAIIVAA